MNEEYSLHALYCCFNMLSLYHGFYIIALHCLLQGFYGFSLICSSTYKNCNPAVNYTAISSNILIMAVGIFIFWIYLTKRFDWSKIISILVIIITVFNMCTMAAYFHRYFHFKANSTFDTGIIAPNENWTPDGLWPLTMWHLFVGIYLLANIPFFYYAYALWLIPMNADI